MKNFEYEKLSINDEGAKRIREENKHPIRSNFERDRDRIMYSKAFRRLSGKTQVFLAGNDDHVRTRLTHTLEVSQISRTIARALKLNEELVEAIALGHDIGHTPFGHVGERMLNSIMNGCYEIGDFNSNNILENNRGFKHNWQSIRVASILEDSMNLTDYTLWGILNHSKIENNDCKMKCENENNTMCLFRHEKDKNCNINLQGKESLSFYRNMQIKDENLYNKIRDKWSFEGYIVKLADEVAQRHHDIEDALEYNIIDGKELLEKLKRIFCFEKYKNTVNEYSKYKENFLESINQHNKNLESIEESINNSSEKGKVDVDEYKSKFSKFIVNALTTDIILNVAEKFNTLTEKYNINQEFYKCKEEIVEHKDIVSYSKFMNDVDKELESFLKARILNSYKAQTMDGVGQHIIKELFKAYLINPQQLPDKTIVKLFSNLYKQESDLTKVGNLRNELSKYHFNNIDNSIKSYNEYKIQLLRTICDYIAGMTDKYAIEQHRKLYNINFI